MKKVILSLLSLIILILIADGRIWTNKDGKSFEGELVEVKDNAVTIRRASDRMRFTLPTRDFSQADIEYLRKIEYQNATFDAPKIIDTVETYWVNDFSRGLKSAGDDKYLYVIYVNTLDKEWFKKNIAQLLLKEDLTKRYNEPIAFVLLYRRENDFEDYISDHLGFPGDDNLLHAKNPIYALRAPGGSSVEFGEIEGMGNLANNPDAFEKSGHACLINPIEIAFGKTVEINIPKSPKAYLPTSKEELSKWLIGTEWAMAQIKIASGLHSRRTIRFHPDGLIKIQFKTAGWEENIPIIENEYSLLGENSIQFGNFGWIMVFDKKFETFTGKTSSGNIIGSGRLVNRFLLPTQIGF